jgi:hypothetical protein
MFRQVSEVSAEKRQSLQWCCMDDVAVFYLFLFLLSTTTRILDEIRRFSSLLFLFSFIPYALQKNLLLGV